MDRKCFIIMPIKSASLCRLLSSQEVSNFTVLQDIGPFVVFAREQPLPISFKK